MSGDPRRALAPLVDALALVALMGLALALRWPYGAQGLWWDEYLVPYYASLELPQLLRAFVVEEAHPPLYFLLSKGIVGAVGDAPRSLRALSLLCGVATIPLLYGLGRSFLGSRRVGLTAAAFLAVWPWHVDFSGHARPYALFTLLACASTGALGALIGSERAARRARWAIAYALLTGLSLGTHYYTVLVVAAHGLGYVATRGWRRLDPAVLAAAWLGAATIFYPWFWVSNILPTAPTFGGALTPWVPARGLGQVLATLDVAVGMRAPRELLLPAVVLAAVAAVQALRRRGDARAWLLVSWLLVPPLALGAVSLALALTHGSPVYQPRQLIFVLPAGLLLLAAALGEARSRAAAALVAAGLVAGSLASLPPRLPPLERIVDTIAEQGRAGDVVIVEPRLSYQVLAHYARGTSARDLPILPLIERGDDAESLKRRLRSVLERAGRVWVVERHVPGYALSVDPVERELFAPAFAEIDGALDPARAWLHRGTVAWKLTLYVPRGEPVEGSAEASRGVRVSVELPPSWLTRESLLVEPPESLPPTGDFPAQEPRWFHAIGDPGLGSYRTLHEEAAAARRFGEALGEPVRDDRARTRVPADGRARVLVVLVRLGALRWVERVAPFALDAPLAPRELVIRPDERALPRWLLSRLRIAAGVLVLGGLLVELATRGLDRLPATRERWRARAARPASRLALVAAGGAVMAAALLRGALPGSEVGPSAERALVERTLWGSVDERPAVRPPPSAKGTGSWVAWLRYGAAGLVGVDPDEARLVEGFLGESLPLETVRGRSSALPDDDPALLVVSVDAVRSAEELLGEGWSPVPSTGPGDGARLPRVVIAEAGRRADARLLASPRARLPVLVLTVPDPGPVGGPGADPCRPGTRRATQLVELLDALVARGWVEARVAATASLADRRPLIATSGHGELAPDAFRGVLPLVIGGESHARGLDAHAPSCGLWWLGGRFARLSGGAGLWDAGNPERGVPGDPAGRRGEASFDIVVDGRVRWSSGPMGWDDDERRFDLPLAGARSVALRVHAGDDLAYDWSIWTDLALAPAAVAEGADGG